MRSRTMLLAAAALAPALFWAGCTARAHSAPAPARAFVRSVAAARVSSARPRLIMNLPAELAAYQDVKLQARVTGFIGKLYVDRGSRVREGQLLAELDAPDLRAKQAQTAHQLASAQSLRLEASATLQRDQATLNRLQGAAKAMPGAVAGNDIQVAQQAVAAGQAEVEARLAAVQAAQAALDAQSALTAYLRVTAPFSGMIIRRDASVGALAGPTQPSLFEEQQLNPLRLVVDVPEAETVGIPLGARLSFTVANQPGRTFTGTVARISHSVRTSTRTMPVELGVANPNLVLAPGMFVQVQWTFQRRQPTLFVPASAVVRSSERTFVERIGPDSRLQWVEVSTGFTEGANIEVFGDLHPGDRVVAAADDDLRPGQQVRLASPPSPAAAPRG
ncbi:MAG: efflux RND transporter periplasmic adaptor subunit [Terriglobales bacterium]